MADPETKDEEIIDAGNETEADASPEPEQGEVGDDGEDAPESDGAETKEEVEDKPSRAETRFQKLSNTAKEANERADRLEREFQEFKTSQRHQAQQETPDQIAQRLALMTPEERLEYRLDQAERRNSQTMANMQFQMQDTGDKSAFTALCASDATAARYKDRVEAELTRLRSQGQNVSREALFTYMFGQDVRTKSGEAKRKQGKVGERNIERQRVAPSNSRGDSQPAKRGEKSLEEKLENVTF